MLYSLLIILIILVIAFIAWWNVMQWEFTNYNNNTIGLIDPTLDTLSWIKYNTVLPPWSNDAWLSTYKQGLYFQARYL